MSGRGRLVIAAAVGLLVALLTGLALLPASGDDSDPPVCRAWGGYEVSCTTWPAWIAVAAGGVLAAAIAWRILRRQAPGSQARVIVR